MHVCVLYDPQNWQPLSQQITWISDVCNEDAILFLQVTIIFYLSRTHGISLEPLCLFCIVLVFLSYFITISFFHSFYLFLLFHSICSLLLLPMRSPISLPHFLLLIPSLPSIFPSPLSIIVRLLQSSLAHCPLIFIQYYSEEFCASNGWRG
jgi:hypothetical protein